MTPPKQNERKERYGKVIWEASRADEGTISVTGANHVASAVMAVADAELEEAYAQRRLLLKSWQNAWEWHSRVGALLDEYDVGVGEGRLAERIRAAMATPVGEGRRLSPDGPA